MSLIDLLTLCAFGGAVVASLMGLIVLDLRSNQSHARIAARMHETFARTGMHARSARGADHTLFTIDRAGNPIIGWLNPKLIRLRIVAGAKGIRIVIGAGISALLLALLAVRLLPLPELAKPLAMVGLPMFAIVRTYNGLVERFRQRFLDLFPDAIDLIVRAVRAGVPVTHVLGVAANECPEPLAREFRLMSDSLSVGRDLSEVLHLAAERIRIADFSFFAVCLLLQREIGGQLGETLENLSKIVRTRREIRQKTHALTAEARVTTKILAAIPVVILLVMYVMNRTYVTILFERQEGQKLLTFAFLSILLGIGVINKMAKLDTSR
jgi:tight adherence protein B